MKKYRDFRAPWWVLAWDTIKRVSRELLAGLGFASIFVIAGLLAALG